MPKVRLIAMLACTAVCAAACATNSRPGVPDLARQPDARTVAHVLNRAGFGPRPGDIERVQSLGLRMYIEDQLHPERVADNVFQPRLESLSGLDMTALAFATDFYLPMAAARQQFTNTQKASGNAARPAHLGWHLLPVAAMSLPGGDKPVSVIGQPAIIPEELKFQRENQKVFDDLQAQKLLRAVYSERQLQEVLTDFWFNHFNVDARKIEDRPVMIEYERTIIRPLVLGKFRNLLEATAKSPAMLFYLDNWLSRAVPPAQNPAAGAARSPRTPPGAGSGLNENYGRELMELHTLGVDGGYTQADVIEVARSFTGWTMRKPREATGFEFNDKMHDHGEKRVLGHKIKAGRGIEDGEEVLDILAKHPSAARFIATKLVRRFVADDPPRALVDRVAKTFLRTDGDLREVMKTILTSPEFYAPAAYRAKVKTPFEFVASALRATNANLTNVRGLVGTIAAMGEPLYQCQPPTGYGDRAELWISAGTLFARLNFAHALATNGIREAKVDAGGADSPLRFAASVLADDVSPQTRDAVESARVSAAARIGLLLGSPEFQRR